MLKNITRPEKISFEKELSKAYIVIEKDKLVRGILVDINTAPVIVPFKEEIDRKTFVDIDKMIDGTLYKKFNRTTFYIGKIVRLSELVNDSLATCISNYLVNHPLEDLQNRNSKCKELKKYDFKKRLSFMQLKQVLSCIIKTEKKLHEVTGLESPESRNEFTLCLANYIQDRDFYVHGNLFFLYPDFEIILKANSDNEDFFISISEKIFQDNLRAYKSLLQIIKSVTYFLQQEQHLNI